MIFNQVLNKHNFLFVIMLCLCSTQQSHAMAEKIEATPISAQEINNLSTRQLLEIASLLREQRYWIELIDAVVNNNIPHSKPAKDLNGDAQELLRKLTTVDIDTNKVLENQKKEGSDLDSSSDQQMKNGFRLFFGLYISAQRNTQTDCQHFVKTLADHGKIDLLEPLRVLTSILRLRENVPHADIAKEIINTYAQLLPKINAAINQHKTMIPRIAEVYNTIIDELKDKRTTPENIFTMINIFSGCPLFVIESVEIIREHVTKSWKSWSTPQLVEIASLIREQEYWMAMVDITVNNVPANKYSETTWQNSRAVLKDTNKALIEEKKGNVNYGQAPVAQKFKGLNFFNCWRFCAHRNDKKTLLGYNEFVTILARYADLEILSPLRELTSMIQHQKKDDSSIAQDLINNYNKLYPKICALIDRYGKIHSQLKQSLQEIIGELSGRTTENVTLHNIFSGEIFVLCRNFVMGQQSDQPAAQNTPDMMVAPFMQVPTERSETSCSESQSWQSLPTPQLLDIASLLKEQAYFFTMLDAIINEPQGLDARIIVNRTEIDSERNKLMDSQKEEYASLSQSADQKEKGLTLFSGIMHCISHNKIHHMIFKEYGEILDRYPRIDLLSPLRRLLATIPAKVALLDLSKQFIQDYDQFRLAINDLIHLHQQMLPQLQQSFDAIMTELKARTTLENEDTMRNVFSGNPFVELRIRGELPKLVAESSQNYLSVEKVPKIDSWVNQPAAGTVMPDEKPLDKIALVDTDKTMDLDINKLPPQTLREIASLLHEQATCIAIFDAILRNLPDEKLDSATKNACNAINMSVVESTIQYDIFVRQSLLASISDFGGLRIYCTFYKCFGDMKIDSTRLLSILSHYHYREFLPLNNLATYFDAIQTIFSKNSAADLFDGNATIQDLRNKLGLTKLRPKLSAIVHRHDSMISDLTPLYDKIIQKLTTRSGARHLRHSIFSDRLMPKQYSSRQPNEDERMLTSAAFSCTSSAISRASYEQQPTHAGQPFLTSTTVTSTNPPPLVAAPATDDRSLWQLARKLLDEKSDDNQ